MLKKIKERIKEEARHGDVNDAIERSGTSRNIYHNAMSRTSYSELSLNEEKVLLAMIDILNKRAERRAEILKKV